VLHLKKRRKRKIETRNIAVKGITGPIVPNVSIESKAYTMDYELIDLQLIKKKINKL